MKLSEYKIIPTFIGFSAGIVISGYLSGVLTIPTSPATHKATLNELHIGVSGDNSVISLDKNNNVSIAGGLTVGETTNVNEGVNSTIAGGGENTIGASASNSIIGAGRQNKVSAPNVTIGAGRRNEINNVAAEGSFIGAGEINKIQGKYSSIGAGRDNSVGGNYSVVVGGSNNSVSADYSVALGEATNIQHSGTFAWSDYSGYQYQVLQGKPNLESTKDNTFLVRSLNGMGINTGSSHAGVNVFVNGAVYLGGSSKLIDTAGSCTGSTQGTFEMTGGCYYFCDGKYWQVTNLSFGGDDAAVRCNHPNAATKLCDLDGFKLRAGDVMTGFSVGRANDCSTVRTTVTCQIDGTLDKPTYKYANCFTLP